MRARKSITKVQLRSEGDGGNAATGGKEPEEYGLRKRDM